MAQINKPNQYFNTKLYTGTGASASITGVGFQPDWVWIKSRTSADWHILTDVIRGATTEIYTNANNGNNTNVNQLTSFDSDGFSLGGAADTGRSGENFVSWNWLADNTSGSSNTDGSITSTVSANTTSGFSICTFTVSGSGDQSFGHGLGATPKMVITKATSSTSGWNVYHENASSSTPEDYYLSLNATDGISNLAGVWGAGMTSSVAGVGVGVGVSPGLDYVAYCFAEKKSFSKFGSYTGNGSTDGTFVYTGMKPSFVILKRTDSTSDWVLLDNKRDSFNLMNKKLFPSNSDSEYSGQNACDFLSNGFKLRDNATNAFATNISGASYIYMCFAESPLVGTNNIPAVAR